VELILLKFITISARADWTMMSFPEGDVLDATTLNGRFFEYYNATAGQYTAPYTYSRLGFTVGAGIALGGKK
jgi:hypothetical protein